MELLVAADTARLARLVGDEPRSVRHLLGRLWDPDDAVRAAAARGIGAAAAAHPELGRDILRRLLWALNDESATNGAPGIAAIGEIGARAPELAAPFVAPLASLAWDDGLRLEILRALTRIAEQAPELVAPVLASTAAWVDRDSPSESSALEQLEMELRGHNDDE